MEKVQSFTDLLAWRKAHSFVLQIYKITKAFPSEEKYCLTDQMRRASISVTSNLAEGFYRRTSNDKSHFYYDALASVGELQSQLMIARDLKYITKEIFSELIDNSMIIQKLIKGLIRSSMTKISA